MPSITPSTSLRDCAIVNPPLEIGLDYFSLETAPSRASSQPHHAPDTRSQANGDLLRALSSLNQSFLRQSREWHSKAFC